MAAPSVDDLARSFERYLRAGNKSPRTIEGSPPTRRSPPAGLDQARCDKDVAKKSLVTGPQDG